MIRWIPDTFIRIVLFFAGGIVLGIYHPNLIQELPAAIILVLLVAFYLGCFTFFRLFKKSYFNLGWVAFPVVFLSGYVNVLFQTGSRAADHFLYTVDSIAYYQIQVNSYAQEKEKSWKMEGRVQRVFTD